MKPMALGLVLILLIGCQQFPGIHPSVDRKSVPVYELAKEVNWLREASKIAQFDVQQCAAEIATFKTRQSDLLGLFQYALLHQQLGNRDGWVKARDILRQLLDNDTLRNEQRQLINIYLNYNQALINWHQRHRNLQREFATVEFERQKLEQQIQDLTHLEQDLSLRKEKRVQEELQQELKQVPRKSTQDD